MARIRQPLVLEVGVFDELKTCCKCKNALPLSAFSARVDGKSGTRSNCKACCSKTELHIVQKPPTEKEQELIDAFDRWKKGVFVDE